ncbi:hypothetical protein [Enterococcus gilvus]|uniref:hypothetical protein n=1 Tax=Enterococcus gilvus TaxID=160453 RepID=UPI00345F0FC3
MLVGKKKTVEQINFLASANYQNFTEQAEKSYKAGEVYPANDATAKGIIFNDVTVTAETGPQPCAVMVEGYVLEDRLPETVADAAKTAMKEIKFR